MNHIPFLGAALPEDSLSFPRELYVSLLSPLNEGQWLSLYILSSLRQKVAAIEDTLEREGKMPSFYKRYVDDTLTIMPDTTSAATFLQVLNNCHSSVKFTIETENNGMLPFLGMQLLNRAPQISEVHHGNREQWYASAYCKPAVCSLQISM